MKFCLKLLLCNIKSQQLTSNIQLTNDTDCYTPCNFNFLFDIKKVFFAYSYYKVCYLWWYATIIYICTRSFKNEAVRGLKLMTKFYSVKRFRSFKLAAIKIPRLPNSVFQVSMSEEFSFSFSRIFLI